MNDPNYTPLDEIIQVQIGKTFPPELTVKENYLTIENSEIDRTDVYDTIDTCKRVSNVSYLEPVCVY